MEQLRKRFMSIVFISVIMSVVILGTHLFLRDEYNLEYYSGRIESDIDIFDESQKISWLNQSNLTSSSTNSNIRYPVQKNSSANFSSLLFKINNINSQQHIHNLDKFDLKADDTTVVIVVQVHNRTEYLKQLVNSLKKVKHIGETLLIFSHDYYHEELDSIVRSIDFCPYMQLYYPYSLQLYTDIFPGTDSRDCPRDTSKERALEIKCQNAEYPDKYGHYREATYTQTKHHWFWKINHVFDYLEVTKHFQGPVLLLEEDHYAVEDAIHVLRQTSRLKSEVCSDCSIITLGTYDKVPKYEELSAKVDIISWQSHKHNMGMAINRKAWQKIKACTDVFCKYDDYNWDWSLQTVGVLCMFNKLKAMAVKSPRVFHVGKCGMHTKGTDCNPLPKIVEIEALVNDQRKNLFPHSMSVYEYHYDPLGQRKEFGGWSDKRDHKLCINFTKESFHLNNNNQLQTLV